MDFFRLATTSKLVEAQLVCALRDGAPARQQAALLRRSADLTERLETHEPRDQVELRDMVGFFVRRASILQRTGEGQRELDVAISVTNRYRDAGLAERTATAETAFEPMRPVGAVIDPSELTEIIATSPERMVAMSRRYRYLGVSAANAAFHRTTQIGMVDLHLSDVIGLGQFQSGAKQRIDACRAGEAQDFVYRTRPPSPEDRAIHCAMYPVRDRHRRLYCVLMRLTEAAASSRDRDLTDGCCA